MKPSAVEEESEPEDGVIANGEEPCTPPQYRGVSIEVPQHITSTSQQPPQETPVGVLRRYLDIMPQHPSPGMELKSGAVWRSLRSEVVASFLLTVISAAASIRPLLDLNHPRILSTSSKELFFGSDSQDAFGFGWGAEWALGHGLTLGALTWAMRSAQFSLPTTLALFTSRKISFTRALLHILAQLFGSLIATPVLFGLLPRPPRAPCLSPATSASQGWGAEFVATLLVSLVSLSGYESATASARINNQSRSSHVGDSYTPRIAHGAVLPLIMAHTSAALFTAAFTGVGLNPGRSLALATLTGNWTSHWIWWVGPALGGLTASFAHEYTGARDPRAAPRSSIVTRDGSRPSFLSSSPASPTERNF